MLHSKQMDHSPWKSKQTSEEARCTFQGQGVDPKQNLAILRGQDDIGVIVAEIRVIFAIEGRWLALELAVASLAQGVLHGWSGARSKDADRG